MRSPSSFLLVAGVLACSASVAFARPTASACGFGGLDFSSLMGLDIVGSDGSNTYSYLLSICGALTSSQASRCLQDSPQSAACQTATQQSQSYDIGNWNAASPPTWSGPYIDPAKPTSGVQYTMSGAQACWATGQPQDYLATVQLVCAAKQMPLTVTVPPNSCKQTYLLQTPLACSGAPPAPAAKCGATLGGTAYDLSPLMGTDLTGSDGTQTYKYFASVCGDLSSAATISCTQIQASASACQIQTQGGSGSFVTGEWPGSNTDVTWSYMDDANPKTGVQYTLQGTESCWASGSVQAYTVTVQFECAAQQSKEFTVNIPEGGCKQTYTIQTPHACAGTPPPPGTPCGTTLSGNTFDFSSLTGADLTGSDGTSTYAYDLNVCNVLSSAAAAPCTQLVASASACQRQVQGGSGIFVIGEWISATPQWSWIDETSMKAGVQYTMTGAKACWASGAAAAYTASVQFVCGSDPTPQTFKVSVKPGSCHQNYTIQTSHACCVGCEDSDDGRTALF